MGNLQLTSSAFSDGGEIPRKCGYKNGNKEPPLTVSGVPEGAKSLALIMDDPDAMAAVGKVWVHWVIWNMLNIDGPLTTKRICTWGTNSFGELGYGGPAPPDKRHTYVFKLYALDIETLHKNTKRQSQMKKADVEFNMQDHILEQTTLTGTYAP